MNGPLDGEDGGEPPCFDRSCGASREKKPRRLRATRGPVRTTSLPVYSRTSHRRQARGGSFQGHQSEDYPPWWRSRTTARVWLQDQYEHTLSGPAHTQQARKRVSCSEPAVWSGWQGEPAAACLMGRGSITGVRRRWGIDGWIAAEQPHPCAQAQPRPLSDKLTLKLQHCPPVLRAYPSCRERRAGIEPAACGRSLGIESGSSAGRSDLAQLDRAAATSRHRPCLATVSTPSEAGPYVIM